MPDNQSSPTPQNIPTPASPELSLLAVNGLRSELNIKFDSLKQAMDATAKVLEIQHQDLVRVPTEVQKAAAALRDLLEQKIETVLTKLTGRVDFITAEIDKLGEVTGERFKSIQTQFALLGKATEQLDVANKTAIAAALQAQKESAGETQKTSQAAIAKSETSTSESIKALTSAFNAAILSANDRISDLKGRLDRGEGKTSVTDPAVGAALAELSQGIRSINKDGGTDKDRWSYVIGAVGFIALVAAVVFILLAKH